VTELAGRGVEAAAFAADVRDHASITTRLMAAKQRFGSIDVLEYSPADRGVAARADLPTDPRQSPGRVRLQHAWRSRRRPSRLPDMLARRSGTILFTTGASSVYPHRGGTRCSRTSPWPVPPCEPMPTPFTRHAPSGVQIGHVSIAAWIGQQPGATPEAIAPLY
jgi:hypothetical protein